jgi:hypothetical protein
MVNVGSLVVLLVLAAADVRQVPEDCASDLTDGRHVWHRGSLGSERDDGLVMLVTFGAFSVIFLRVSVAHETAAPQLGQPHPQAADVKSQHIARVQGEVILDLRRVDWLAAAVAGVAAAVAGPHLLWQDTR